MKSAVGRGLALSIEHVNPLVKATEYAVRGRLLDRAKELEADLRSGKPLPFQQIVKCNIGNPQSLGQKPLSYVRQTLSLLMNPALIDESTLKTIYPSDVTERAKRLLGGTPSVGAYSDSQGVGVVRQDVADFIAARDGHPADPADIYLTDGASAGVKALLQLMLRGPKDALLVPVPQVGLGLPTDGLVLVFIRLVLLIPPHFFFLMYLFCFLHSPVSSLLGDGDDAERNPGPVLP